MALSGDDFSPFIFGGHLLRKKNATPEPRKPIDPVAITYLHQVGSVGISGKDWRYIKYHGDDEELYHITEDPYEWNNLANDPKYADKLAEFRENYPKQFALLPEVKARYLIAFK